MQITTRSDAFKNGEKRYFTGKPCRRGHIMERYASSGQCVGCLEKPPGAFVKVSLEVHSDDRTALELFAAELCKARGRVIQTDGMTEDERNYWSIVRRFKKHGAPSSAIPRGYGTFTLPDGVDP